MQKAIRNAARGLKNPAVQRILAWVLPLIFGWILSKLDTSPKDKHK